MQQLNKKRVFIVEDNTQNRLIFGMLLRKHGAHVFFEPWGQNTLEQLKRLEQMDLVILDLMLAGGITGYDIFDQIRTLPTYQAVPIVAVSASEPGLAIPKTRAKGFSGFISKPIDLDLFPQQLTQILNGEAVWSAGEPIP